MRRFENAWFQFRFGVLKEPDWQAIAYDMNSILSYPGARFAWDGTKNRSSKDFRIFVDELVKRQAVRFHRLSAIFRRPRELLDGSAVKNAWRQKLAPQSFHLKALAHHVVTRK